MSELYFHEDDQEMADIDLLSNYVAYSGHTWDIANAQVYSPADEKVEFISANLPLAEVEAVISKVLPRFDKVLSGYGRTTWEVENTTAFGVTNSFAILLESVDGTAINTIWLLVSDITETEIGAIKELFRYLSSKGDFLYTDNHWNFQCKTNEQALFEAYCEDKFEIT